MAGGFGTGGSKKSAQPSKPDGSLTHTEVQASDVAELLAKAKSVIITPGYGLAVAQAQHVISELSTSLRARYRLVSFLCRD